MCQSIWQPFHFKYGEIKSLKDLYLKVKKKKKLEISYIEFCIFVIHL